MSRSPASMFVVIFIYIFNLTLNAFLVLNPTEQDIQLLLAAQCHIGTKNATAAMKPYVFKRRPDGKRVLCYFIQGIPFTNIHVNRRKLD